MKPAGPTRPIARYHGGKWRLAPWILEHFPAHRVYVEPFGGGGSVLLRKPRTYAEIYNDLDGEMVNLFRVARDRGAERVIVERLQGVYIEDRDATRCICEHDGRETLHYVDPPYVHSTRAMITGRNSKRGYRHEMSDDDHRLLAAVLHGAKGMVVLSGYACDLYDQELYADWERHERAHLADGARKRTEVLYLNPACSDARRTGQLEIA